MADTGPDSLKMKWLWLLVIIVLGVLAVVFIISPSGDRDGDIDDPVAVDDIGQPEADTALEDVRQGEGLTQDGMDEEPAADDMADDPMAENPSVETLPE